VLLTLFAQPNEVTNGKPKLGPPETSYHVHQPFCTRISHEMRVGMRDLRAISGHRFDVFVTQSYYRKWRVNRVDFTEEFCLVLKSALCE